MSETKTSYSCPCCDEAFDDKMSFRGHIGGKEANPPWQIKEVLKRLYWEEGLSQEEVADQLGCGVSTVVKWMGRHGIDTRSISEANQRSEHYTKKDTTKKLENEEWLEKKYWEEEQSTADIASEIGCSATSVRMWMERHGIRRRNASEWGELTSEKEIEENTPEQLLDEDWLRTAYIKEKESTTDIAERLNCGHSTVCSWLKRHGIDISYDGYFPTGEDHWNYGGGLEEYGPGWQSKRRKVRSRDDYMCQRCGLPESEHKSKWGQELHVHHIIPRKEFLDENGDFNHQEANSLDNLIAVCRDCHELLEGVPIDTRDLNEAGFDAE